ncbi:MAG TPA: hypothetical protein P5262_03615 [Candidatus Moranbacteria bacterium]|nr:hypothetical protein [Candidatus Moranbacteria bacterium]
MDTLKKRSLFWDVEGVDPQENEQFVIERILDFGDEKDFRWALKFYGEDRLKAAILKSRSITGKSLYFWCQFFNLKINKCLANQSILKQSAFSKR